MIEQKNQDLFWEMVKAQTDRGAILAMVYKELEILQNENSRLKGDLDTTRRSYEFARRFSKDQTQTIVELTEKLGHLEKCQEFLDDVGNMITDQLSGKESPTIIGAKPPTAAPDEDNDGQGDEIPDFMKTG